VAKATSDHVFEDGRDEHGPFAGLSAGEVADVVAFTNTVAGFVPHLKLLSDLLCSSLDPHGGRRSLAVHGADYFREAEFLQGPGRVHSSADADFSERRPAYLGLTTTLDEIATRIAEIRESLSHELVVRGM
jgi:hypothetical protein